jgi:hypothetical protein
MSKTIDSFNDLMEQFIDELVLTFPDVSKFKQNKGKFAIIRTTNPKRTCKQFIDAIKPYASQVMAKDEVFFMENADKIEFLEDFDMKSIWTPALSAKTKEAIWQYIQTMYILGTTITSLPDETLSAIEDIAKKFDTGDFGPLLEMLGKNPMNI